ncbi:hypothetical protein ST47_g10076 [Ascochyta rabiei]|uniref:Uncharacterized protein n=1 Tax=Didymella rabiei TaxID=5454 RepID=A0A162W0X8_DIDRA|nr:hypothetical protein ST47_g10076 [Ascochyta rabiei]
MEASVQLDTPAFTRLPVELLTMILDQRYSNRSGTCWGHVVDHATLKSLRLACRQYAYLPRLLEKVFRGIQLVASHEQVNLAETLDLSVIKPYVKTIAMEPTKYSWAMTEEVFRDIVLVTPLQEWCYDVNQKRLEMMKAGGDVSGSIILGRKQFAELGMRGFVQQYMGGKMPVSSAELGEGFQRYMQHAQSTHTVFETRQVQHAWTRVFTQLPDAHVFRIGRWECEGRGESSWRDWGCDVQPHEHYYGKGYDNAVCRRLQEPVGEALYSTAIASLVAARAKITQLHIESVVDGNFAWAHNGALDDLDLSHLQTLSFQPLGAEPRVEYDSGSEREAAVHTYCSLAITTLLRKCSTSLQKLTLFPGFCCYDMAWPLSDIPASNNLLTLPALKSLTTGLSLALFLHQCSALEYLQLDSCHREDGEWRELWDAIRDHPDRMTLEFTELPCNSCAEVGVSHHTGEASGVAFSSDPWSNIGYSLENYLSGGRHWGRSLRMRFEEGSGKSSESESDEDGDEDEDESDADEDMDSGSEVEDNE